MSLIDSERHAAYAQNLLKEIKEQAKSDGKDFLVETVLKGVISMSSACLALVGLAFEARTQRQQILQELKALQMRRNPH